MTQCQCLTIQFWGTRGSMTPHLPSSEFGIHTTCLELIPGNRTSLFVDLGTGAAPASKAALERGVRDFDVFLTHLHSDHLNGMFAFAPLYHSDCRVRIHAARTELEATLRRFFAPPVHPVSLDRMQAALELIELPENGQMVLENQDATLTWVRVPHPQGSTAYQIETDAGVFTFITDVELSKTDELAPLKKMITGSRRPGLAAIDGFFTAEELPRFRDWGHSTWQEARKLVMDTGIAELLITHHHPGRTDQELKTLEETARPVRWARENQPWIIRNNRAAPLHER